MTVMVDVGKVNSLCYDLWLERPNKITSHIYMAFRFAEVKELVTEEGRKQIK
jgi:hypothetical protein